MRNKLIYLSLFILTIGFSSCTSWVRLGEMTIISTRNFESKKDYELKQQYAKQKVSVRKAKKMNVDPLTYAVEKLVQQETNGEFVKNARIYMSRSGRKFKVEGDIWGLPRE